MFIEELLQKIEDDIRFQKIFIELLNRSEESILEELLTIEKEIMYNNELLPSDKESLLEELRQYIMELRSKIAAKEQLAAAADNWESLEDDNE